MEVQIVEEKVLKQLLYIFSLYLGILFLNIGGFFTSFYAVNLFYIIVPISVLLSLFVGRYSWYIPSSSVYKLFWGFIFVYLIVSLASFFLVSIDENYPLIYNLRTFGYSIINVYIFYRLSILYRKYGKFELLLVLLGRISFIAMLLTALFPLFKIVPIDYIKASDSLMTLAHSYNIRLTGFYLNPNLTGYVANISLVFAMSLIIYKQRINLFAVSLFLVSIYISIRSFSKTAIIVTLILTMLFFLFLLLKKSFWLSSLYFQRRFLVFSALSLGLFLLFKSASWYQSLDEGQKQRIDQVFSIVYEAEINEKTTTHRSAIWDVGLNKIRNSPIIGNGFGSFDYFPEKGQGIHNMYLKIFGETGILIGLYYLFLHVLIFFTVFSEAKSHLKFLGLGLVMATMIFNFSNHNAFQTPIISMVYGLLLSFSNHHDKY